MSVEVPGTFIARAPCRSFQQTQQQEGSLHVFGAKTEILIVAPDLLGIQIDVEELACFHRLGDSMDEGQPGHCLMGKLRVHADHVRVVQRGDEVKHVPCGGEIDVSARLVGFGLQGELHVVPLISHIFAEEVDRIPHAADGVAGIAAGVGFRPLPSSPEHVDLGSKLGSEVDGVHGLLEGQRPHLGVVGCEGPVLERRMPEQIRSRHGNDHPRVRKRSLELFHYPIPLRQRGAKGNKVVIVQVHSPSAALGELANKVRDIRRRTHRVPERVSSGVAHGPQAKAEPIFFGWSISIHDVSYREGAAPLALRSLHGRCREATFPAHFPSNVTTHLTPSTNGPRHSRE